MAEYIEREALKEHLKSYAGVFTDEIGFAVSLESVLGGIDFQPAADVEKVVRCKDCNYYGDDEFCPSRSLADYTNPYDFCSYGERRESDV